jgi:hypothetical protein
MKTGLQSPVQGFGSAIDEPNDFEHSSGQANPRSMQLYSLDPLHDSRWDEFVVSHPRSSAFHQRGWLDALVRTYGFRPIVLTSTPAGKRLSNGVVFCEVKSSITGSRLVSLPFADHTEPLLDDFNASSELMEWMRTESQRNHWKYIELRPLFWKGPPDCPLAAHDSFGFHTLDLTPSIEQLFSNLHKNSLQRRIRRAERERLSYVKGCSQAILDDFYRLLMITRRRHRLLPQPRAWFRNLVDCMSPNVEIRLARKDGVPIAAVLTLIHRRTVVYKYGCSDERYHHLGGMPLLFWRVIEESNNARAEQLDLGRTDLDNRGLMEFKDRFGGTRTRLTYLRYPGVAAGKGGVAFSSLPFARSLFSVLPDTLSSRMGRLLYRHMG